MQLMNSQDVEVY